MCNFYVKIKLEFFKIQGDLIFYIKGGHGGMAERSQDKRIRKPKIEKGKETKLKRKEKKRKQIQFHRKY